MGNTVLSQAFALSKLMAVVGVAETREPLAPHVGYTSLRPKQYDVMAIVQRTGAVLSPAAQVMIEMATKHIQSITEPV